VIKPFQTVVNLFATPKYREWDPTPIISYSFALFFGLMVGDVVYALGIMLLGKYLLGKLVDDPQSENFKLFQRLIYTCAGAALIVGLLSGTYLGDIFKKFFGVESLALVGEVGTTLQDPIKFIVLALIIGFVHVNIGHLMALIKGVKEKQRGLVITKIGLFLLQFGIPSILHSLLNVDTPFFTEQIYSILIYVMGVGVMIVVAGNIIQSGGLGMIAGIFDLTGVLGDIMSYARLAGVGLATFYLASAFNMLAELFSSLLPGTVGAIIGGIIGIGILIFGHLINLVLGVITGFIHSLRLCFVEFLFKFYEGGGREYSPFKLKKRISTPISV
jgi:V/A-type H+-transporting ATPase subunit I